MSSSISLTELEAARQEAYDNALKIKQKGLETAKVNYKIAEDKYQAKINEAKAKHDKSVSFYTEQEENMRRNADKDFEHERQKLLKKQGGSPTHSSKAAPEPEPEAKPPGEVWYDLAEEHVQKNNLRDSAPASDPPPAPRNETDEERKARQRALVLALGRKHNKTVRLADGTVVKPEDNKAPPATKVHSLPKGVSTPYGTVIPPPDEEPKPTAEEPPTNLPFTPLPQPTKKPAKVVLPYTSPPAPTAEREPQRPTIITTTKRPSG